MKPRNDVSGKIFRLTVAVAAFVLTLSGVFILGFGIKFQSSPSNGEGKTSKPTQQLFYKSIGQTSPALEKKTPAAQTTFSHKFTIELKVVNKREEAEALISKLEKQGIKAYFTPFNSRGRVFYRVRQGIYTTEASAQQFAAKLRTAQNLPVTVVRLQ
jgi:cell division septation protein DedD